MKNILLTLALASVCFFPTENLYSQKGFCIGLLINPQTSSLLNSNDGNDYRFKYRETYNGAFGITAGLGINKHVGVGVDLLYSLQGQRYQLNNVVRNKEVNYLKIPVLFVFRGKLSDNWSFIGKTGPQFSILSSAQFTDRVGAVIVSDQSAAYKSFTCGGVIYAGFSYRVNDNTVLDLLLRGDYDFTNAENPGYCSNINNPQEAVNSSRAPSYNMTEGITLGIIYLFPLSSHHHY